MRFNYKLDLREATIFTVLTIILLGSSIFFYTEGVMFGVIIFLSLDIFVWVLTFWSCKYPDGFKVGSKMGYGNRTGDDIDIPISKFENGQGRKENGSPVKVKIINPLTYKIKNRHICEVTIIEKVEAKVYRGWMSMREDY